MSCDLSATPGWWYNNAFHNFSKITELYVLNWPGKQLSHIFFIRPFFWSGCESSVMSPPPPWFCEMICRWAVLIGWLVWMSSQVSVELIGCSLQPLIFKAPLVLKVSTVLAPQPASCDILCCSACGKLCNLSAEIWGVSVGMGLLNLISSCFSDRSWNFDLLLGDNRFNSLFVLLLVLLDLIWSQCLPL